MQNTDLETIVELPAEGPPLAEVAPEGMDVISAPDLGGLETMFSADFFSGPAEMTVAALAIVGVFILVTGLMLNLATELTEDGDWFFCGVGVPAVLATYVLGWGLFGAWTMGTVVVMLYQRGKPIHWATVLPGAILAIGIGISVSVTVLREPTGGWLEPVIPWFLILAGTMIALKASWRRYAKWLLAISVPATARFVLGQLVAPDSPMIHTFNLAALALAAVLILAVPLTLAFVRKAQCFRPLLLGSGLFLGGSAILAATLAAHYAYFAR